METVQEGLREVFYDILTASRAIVLGRLSPAMLKVAGN